MSHKENDKLVDVLKDMAWGLTDEYKIHPEREITPLKAGPNTWDEVTCLDFGKFYDYEILDHGETQVIFPVCKAALQWCYRFLPEDCPRWQTGFVVETRYLPAIIEGMSGDGLISEDEIAAHFNEELSRQWE